MHFLGDWNQCVYFTKERAEELLTALRIDMAARESNLEFELVTMRELRGRAEIAFSACLAHLRKALAA